MSRCIFKIRMRMSLECLHFVWRSHLFLIVHIYQSLNNAPALRHFLGWPHFPWNFVSGILAVRKVINHGNPRWCVSSLVDGKRSQRFFRTKEDAHTQATSLRNDPRAGDSTNGALRLSEGATSFKAVDSALHLQVSQPDAFQAIHHLDPTLHTRLNSALQWPDLKPKTRAKIDKILKANDPQKYTTGRHHSTWCWCNCQRRQWALRRL